MFSHHPYLWSLAALYVVLAPFAIRSTRRKQAAERAWREAMKRQVEAHGWNWVEDVFRPQRPAGLEIDKLAAFDARLRWMVAGQREGHAPWTLESGWYGRDRDHRYAATRFYGLLRAPASFAVHVLGARMLAQMARVPFTEGARREAAKDIQKRLPVTTIPAEELAGLIIPKLSLRVPTPRALEPHGLGVLAVGPDAERVSAFLEAIAPPLAAWCASHPKAKPSLFLAERRVEMHLDVATDDIAGIEQAVALAHAVMEAAERVDGR